MATSRVERRSRAGALRRALLIPPPGTPFDPLVGVALDPAEAASDGAVAEV
jgi:hypothetical protein